MATQEVLTTITLIAAADLSAKQFFGVILDSAGKAALAGTAGQVIGILQNKPTSGQAAIVAISGVSKAAAGGTCTMGKPISADSAGKFVDSSTGQRAIGRAMETGAAGRTIRVLVDILTAETI